MRLEVSEMDWKWGNNLWDELLDKMARLELEKERVGSIWYRRAVRLKVIRVVIVCLYIFE